MHCLAFTGVKLIPPNVILQRHHQRTLRLSLASTICLSIFSPLYWNDDGCNFSLLYPFGKVKLLKAQSPVMF